MFNSSASGIGDLVLFIAFLLMNALFVIGGPVIAIILACGSFRGARATDQVRAESDPVGGLR